MKISQKLILLISFFFMNSSIAASQSLRHTSFDNRQTCDESKGVWREFGNGCADNCESKFDKYEICTSALTYACDCGKGRCWHENKCLSVASYKKIFDKENDEKQNLLEAKAKERQDRIKNDPTLSNYLQNLYVQKDATVIQNGQVVQNQQAVQQKTTQTNQKVPAQPQTNAITQATPPQDIAPQPIASVTQVQGVLDASSPVATGADGSQQIKIPPAFLQQEKDRKQQAESAAPALPIIPLP